MSKFESDPVSSGRYEVETRIADDASMSFVPE